MEILSTLWQILTGHPVFSLTFFIGLVLYIIGARLNYKIEEEKFNRRNASGVMEFESFKQSVTKKKKWAFMGFVGKLGLWMWMFSLIALLIKHFA